MSTDKPQQRWRENIEALTMAIVVALLFKYFVLEISKIPSGSMQPTLMGNPETGVFDRTLVDKLSMQFRDPERFEIVVFKHPLERSRIMVKRLVGMPGEEFKIQYGDVWTRANGDEPWKILRRPLVVQRGMWRALAKRSRNPSWSIVLGGKEWRMLEDSIAARGDGSARFRASDGPIRDVYQDGYPQAVASKIPTPHSAQQNHAVGDLRLEGELVALAGTTSLTFEMTEGQRVYEFTLPGPAAALDAKLHIRIRDSANSTESSVEGEPFRLEAGERVSFAVQNLDDRLALELDGRERLATEIEPSERQEASITLSVRGEGADLTDLGVARDIWYETPQERGKELPFWTVQIPAGHYVMLGDNTQDSADSRLWEAKTFSYPTPEGEVRPRGNYRETENPAFGSLADGRSLTRFKDHLGEVHWFASKLGPQGNDGGQEKRNEPLVPRELIVGRALAIFWPIWPFQGLWRVGWLR